MKYFAYGSNMSLARFAARITSARRLGVCRLFGYQLRFHKVGADDSAKCNAFATDIIEDSLLGVLYSMDPAELPELDRIEGLGWGYARAAVGVIAADGSAVEALTYLGTRIDETLKPYDWYLNHVLIGAREVNLPQAYIEFIASHETLPDPDTLRAREQFAVHRR